MNVSIDSPARGASVEGIQRHYDLGDDFFRLWLDENLIYSCALWELGDSLETAQLRKLDQHVAEARAAQAKRVLDVGCGWGALLSRLVQHHRVSTAVGLTLSRAQATHIAARATPGVDVQLESWEDHAPNAPYDAIISVEAFEHFARPGLSSHQRVERYGFFFERCRGLLVEGGWMSLQTSAYGLGRYRPCIFSDMFPESDLPRLAEIAAATEHLFEIVRVYNDRAHYTRTVGVWLERLQARRQEAVTIAGPETVERFEKYLKFVAHGFHQNTFELYRITLRRIDA